MRQLFNALVFLVVFLLGCQSNNSKVPLNGPKRSVTNIKRGTLEFYVDVFTIALLAAAITMTTTSCSDDDDNVNNA